MTQPDLTPRQRELMVAFVEAWEASSHTPFDLDSGQFDHPSWPTTIRVPTRAEVRALVHLDLLDTDRDVLPTWRVFPSPKGRHLGGVAAEEALADPDGRLGLILEATAKAFEADPSQPLRFERFYQQAHFVRHPHWPLQPDVVRAHDLQQLEDLRLIATAIAAADSSMTFWPTIRGRAAVKNAVGYLERLAQETEDDGEKSRLRRWAARLRGGDIAVGTITSTSGALIRALIGP